MEKEALINDFLNLLDMGTVGKPTEDENVFEGCDRATVNSSGPRVDLIFGSNSQLRAFAGVYACMDSPEKFLRDFVEFGTRS